MPGYGYPSPNKGLTPSPLSGQQELKPVSPWTPPPVDYGRIDQLTQELSAPSTRRLRSGLRESFQSAQGQENPAVQAMLMRRSLEGYGTGIEQAIAGGRSGALSAYQQEYAPLVDASRLTWAENALRERANREAALNEEAQVRSGRLGGSSRGGGSAPQSINYGAMNPLASVPGSTKSMTSDYGQPASAESLALQDKWRQDAALADSRAKMEAALLGIGPGYEGLNNSWIGKGGY